MVLKIQLSLKTAIQVLSHYLKKNQQTVEDNRTTILLPKLIQKPKQSAVVKLQLKKMRTLYRRDLIYNGGIDFI
jgi:uncharacterized FlgJ-related protein